MNNHEYLEQRFGRVRSGADLEMRYFYLTEQMEWMQQNHVSMWHNALTGKTKVSALHEGSVGLIDDEGCCLLHALDNLQEKIGEE